MRGISWISGALVSLLMIVLVFVIIAAANMKFQAEVDTYLPYKYAVMVAHRLSSSQQTLSTVFREPDVTSHKNILDDRKVDYFDEKYGEYVSPFSDSFDFDSPPLGMMSPESHLFCYHWHAKVYDYDEIVTVPNPAYYFTSTCVAETGPCPFEETISKPNARAFGRNYLADLDTEALRLFTESAKSSVNNLDEVCTEDYEMLCAYFVTSAAVAGGVLIGSGGTMTPVAVATLVSTAISGIAIEGIVAYRTVKDVYGFVKESRPKEYVLPVAIAYPDGEINPGYLSVSVWKSHGECANKELNEEILKEVRRQGKLLMEGDD